ncbi:hypothetical protein RB195_005555 [Necator americanus]|uniref:Uncharacterized protein n=1 Tax=Necator americanus TaxID=51031 RepID=A0ABR1BNG3_NECAM
MIRHFSTVLLLFVLLSFIEAKPFPGRCRKSMTRCALKRLRRPAFPDNTEHLRVKWSSDGLVGSRRFERDGRHFVEIQELVPIGDGKYRIESRIEETTAPVAEPSPHLPDEPPQDSIAAANNNRRAPTWIEEIAAERSGRWPVSNVDQDYDSAKASAHRMEIDAQKPVQAEVAPLPVARGRHGDHIPQEHRTETRVKEPTPPRLPSYYEQQQRIGGTEQFAAEARHEAVPANPPPPMQEPRMHESSPAKSYSYYDEIWYEPAGQGAYPRLLFSPRYGWREMTQEEMSRVRGIRPMAASGQLPTSERHSIQEHPKSQPDLQQIGEHHSNRRNDHHNGLHRSSYLDSTGHPRFLGDRRQNSHDGSHTRPSSQERNAETPVENRVEGEGGAWVFRGGEWHFEPQNAVEVAPKTALEAASPTHPTGTWVFHNGAWHLRRSPQSASEQRASIPAVKSADNPPSGGKTMVKVRKFHAPDYQGNYRELLAKAIRMDHETMRNRYNGENDTDYSTWRYSQLANQKNRSTDGNKYWYPYKSVPAVGDTRTDVQLPDVQSGSAQYVQKGNMAAIVYSERDQERKRKEEEAGERKKAQGASYFIKEGNMGAYVYTEGENAEKVAQASTGDNGTPVESNSRSHLSVDEFKRLQPSQHKIPRIQLKDSSGIKPCDSEGTTSGNGEFWLLRTRPCNENSPEGRIILPNGEVLRFYGQPQLVNV